MNKDFEIFKQFSDNTKNVSIISAIALLIITLTMISPFGINRYIIIIGKLLAISLLFYSITIMYKETNNLVLNTKDIWKSSSYKVNALLSYILTFLVFLLTMYIAYTFIF
jgi:heme O synthase-like polyprenyltransferase